MLKPSISAVALCLALAAQSALAAPPDRAGPASLMNATHRPDKDPCGLEVAKRYVGGQSGSTVRASLANAVGHSRIRWISPGQAVTQDFREDRLNVILDEDGRILTVRCG